MLIDGISLVDSSVISNTRVEAGAAFPNNPTAGLMFYLDAVNAGNAPGLYVYNGSEWLTGDVSTVTAGTGLLGGGSNGDVTISVDTSVVATKTFVEEQLAASGTGPNTLNPSDKTAGVTLSNGNLTASGIINGQGVRAVAALSSGKWYWETTVGGVASGSFIGVSTSEQTLSASMFSTTAWGYYSNGNFLEGSGGWGTNTGVTYTNDDVIGIALDVDAGTAAFYKNGVLIGTITGLAGKTLYPTLLSGSGSLPGQTQTVNFGPNMDFTIPSGFSTGPNVQLAIDGGTY